MAKEERKVGKREQWTKKCPRCTESWRRRLAEPHYKTLVGGRLDAELYAPFIPDDYEVCDGCLSNEYHLEVTYDALDHLCLVGLTNLDYAIRAIRWALGETYVRH